MTRHLIVLLALLLPGCVTAPAFDVTVTNAGAEATFLTAGEGTGISMRFEEQIGDAWVGLGSSRAAFCQAVCGQPGPVVCADVAAELRGVWALLPGSSETRTFESDWWYRDEAAGCIRGTALVGPTRVEVCFGPAASDDDGQPLDPPTADGFLGAGGGASVDEPACVWTEFAAADGAEIDVD